MNSSRRSWWVGFKVCVDVFDVFCLFSWSPSTRSSRELNTSAHQKHELRWWLRYGTGPLRSGAVNSHTLSSLWYSLATVDCGFCMTRVSWFAPGDPPRRDDHCSIYSLLAVGYTAAINCRLITCTCSVSERVAADCSVFWLLCCGVLFTSTWFPLLCLQYYSRWTGAARTIYALI